MTYGWAILIIAIVLVALFSLGVFNSANFAPKAPPGSCQVFRPNGPGTAFDLNLEGECNGELPQYVARFNGQSSLVDLGSSQRLLGNVFTVAAWVRYAGNGGSGDIPFISFVGATTFLPVVYLNWVYPNTGLIYFGNSNYRYFSLNPVNPLDGNWHFVTVVIGGYGQYDVANDIVYVDGQAESMSGSPTDSGLPITKTGPVYIGAAQYNFAGSIANFQFYNTTLSANDINTLYNEGIGGAPIDITNLVGWWPLNGNANDYSGNQNNGAATNVIYTTSWTNGYTSP